NPTLAPGPRPLPPTPAPDPRCAIIAAAPPTLKGESEIALNQDVTNCPRCRRRTAAARGTCIYCGETLPISKLTSAPPQRNLDAAELAFNTILEPPRLAADEATIAALAAALKLEVAEAGELLAANK